MDRERLSRIAHSDHPIAAPLGDAAVDVLLGRALQRGDERVLDLGCGSGTWLIRALDGRPGVRAEGVDIDAAAIEIGRRALEGAGLGERIALHAQDATQFPSSGRFDVVLCIGATHAFGGLLPTLGALREHLTGGGSVLVGEGFWDSEPNEATLDQGFTPDDYQDLAETVETVRANGWIPIYGHVSSRAEWDDYEWSWTGSLSGWALDHQDDADSGAALQVADEHRVGWLRGYRDSLGFVTLLLRS
jgi:SAM-dependent methyltransferase